MQVADWFATVDHPLSHAGWAAGHPHQLLQRGDRPGVLPPPGGCGRHRERHLAAAGAHQGLASLLGHQVKHCNILQKCRV